MGREKETACAVCSYVLINNVYIWKSYETEGRPKVLPPCNASVTSAANKLSRGELRKKIFIFIFNP